MRIARFRVFAGLLIITGVWSGISVSTLSQVPGRMTGTYTNMYYNKEAGDVVGEELKIVASQGGRFQGALQFAEGEPEDLIVVDITIVGDSISFAVPSWHAGEFKGTIGGGMIRGALKFKNGVTEMVTLRKGKSYWD